MYKIILLLVVCFALLFWWRHSQTTSNIEEMRQLEEEHLQLRQKYRLDAALHNSLEADSGSIAALPADAVWRSMLKTNYEERFGILHIEFDESLSALDGQELHLQGYMIPIGQFAGEHQHFILSYYPYASCYFCGQAGPESVVEVFSRSPQSYKQSIIQLKGTLRLNADDPDKLFHILEDAQILP